MKNKFLIFSFLFAGGFIFLIFPAVSFATITVTTDLPAVGLTSATFNATADTGQTSELYDGRGFNLGTATANQGEYTMGSSTITGALTADDTFNHATTGLLTKGTAYYFRAYISSSTAAASGFPAIIYGSERSFIAGIDAPSGLTSQSAEDSIKITWTAGTGANKTVIKYNDGTTYPTATSTGSGGATVAETDRTFYNLVPEHTYYFSLWSSTTDTTAVLNTTSDSYVTIKSATTGSVSGSGGGRTAPTTYTDSLVINQGAATTKTRDVTLALKAGNASLMSISNDSFFFVPLESYSAAKSWTLTEGDGVKTVYVKFISPDGLNSDIVSDTITLSTPTPTPAPTPEPVPEFAPTPVAAAPELEPTPAPAPVPEPAEKPIPAKIVCAIASFERWLKRGMSGDDIKCLQIILNSDSDTKLAESGAGSPGEETNYFGPLTRAAVIKFQEKFSSDVLAPWGLNRGTGFIGSTTTTKLNSLLGK